MCLRSIHYISQAAVDSALTQSTSVNRCCCHRNKPQQLAWSNVLMQLHAAAPHSKQCGACTPSAARRAASHLLPQRNTPVLINHCQQHQRKRNVCIVRAEEQDANKLELGLVRRQCYFLSAHEPAIMLDLSLLSVVALFHMRKVVFPSHCLLFLA